MFLHQSVRLACDLNRAMALFTRESLVEKWLDHPKIVNKVGGQYSFDLTIDNQPMTLTGKIVKKTFEKQVVVALESTENQLAQWFANGIILEVNLMMSASRTEYCTDVHLIQRGFEDDENGHKARDKFIGFWQEKLEVLRQEINGDWVIDDKELSYSSLMGSRL